MSNESSITVAVRIRPFTQQESTRLIQKPQNELFLGDASLQNSDNKRSTSTNKLLNNVGIRKILTAVDDRMLIFDPADTNPLNQMVKSAFPEGFPSHRRNAHHPNYRHQTGIGHHSSRIREHKFVFDRLFDEDAKQEDVYMATTKPLLDSVLDGFNATIFAYGATGCGKTFTVSGTPESPGIIFSAMKDLFDRIEEYKETKIIELSVSYLEIYNEKIRDLLNTNTNYSNNLDLTNIPSLELREDENKRITVRNLSTHIPNSVEDVMDMIVIGNRNRTVSPTEANATSSRSHAVLQINVVQRSRTADLKEEHTFATLSIIDLAGSERASATKNRGVRLYEGANINKSLLSLGNCINALCDPRRRGHIPYRDSKLTRLLKFSLGGNCKTVMIVCVSPSSQHYDETLNTLKYANRAKEIKTKVVRNHQNLSRHVSSYLLMITEQKREIEELKKRENMMIEKTLNKYTKDREVCLNELTNAIKELKLAFNKSHQAVLNKAFILTKRKFLLLQKFQVEQFLRNFDSRFDSADLGNLTMVFPALGQLYHLCETLLTKLFMQIQDLEHTYSQSNELDFILTDTTKILLRKLKERPGWLESDEVLYHTQVSFLKDSIEKSILFSSSIMFDNSIPQLDKSLQLLTEHLFEMVPELMDTILRNEEHETEQVINNTIIKCCDHLNILLTQGFKLSISEDTLSQLPQNEFDLEEEQNFILEQMTPSSKEGINEQTNDSFKGGNDDTNNNNKSSSNISTQSPPISTNRVKAKSIQQNLRSPFQLTPNTLVTKRSLNFGGRKISNSPISKPVSKRQSLKSVNKSLPDITGIKINSNKKVRWDMPSSGNSDTSNIIEEATIGQHNDSGEGSIDADISMGETSSNSAKKCLKSTLLDNSSVLKDSNNIFNEIVENNQLNDTDLSGKFNESIKTNDENQSSIGIDRLLLPASRTIRTSLTKFKLTPFMSPTKLEAMSSGPIVDYSNEVKKNGLNKVENTEKNGLTEIQTKSNIFNLATTDYEDIDSSMII
ncbi:hypothetical protein B5S28_g2438 [[Candida] boidinii]|nr:hypothetical protein B5S28_g2438 [[Candida] boidinii]OWB61881.1 hypothetical protein B5S29_g2786 [[Candida] boidinii]OWB77262.1 hypothetical protein B5S32_g1423 [[Candida] boidinii]